MEASLSDSLVMDPTTRERGVTPEYLAATRAKGVAFKRRKVGCAEPRLFTPPLRPLTPETSLGFEVIEFAERLLGVDLYPWQKVLLIRALELTSEGRYRFRRIVVIVGRQNGKTMLAGVLAAWWLFVDSKRNPDRVPPFKFKVVGVAQNLEIARQPWEAVKQWCDPEPETDEASDLAIESLQAATEKVIDSNGKERIATLAGPHYQVVAAESARGKPAPKVIFDELREQKTWAAWNAVAHTTKSFYNGQLWAFTNAGYLSSVVLASLRNGSLKFIDSWQSYVESGIQSLEEFANGRSMATGLFEWSAPPGCARDDVDGLLQSNPSVGHGEMTIESLLDEIDSEGYVTEVLGHWVASKVPPHLDVKRWGELLDDASEIADGERVMIGVTVAGDRSFTSIGVAGLRADRLMHVELVASREGLMWVVKFLVALRAKWGVNEVAIQSKGVPSAELVEPLLEVKDERGKPAPFVVHKIEGTPLLNSAGHLSDIVRRGLLRHVTDDLLELTVANATTKRLQGGMPVWDLHGSPVDVGPIMCLNLAVYALEMTAPPKKRKSPPPPPKAEAISRVDIDSPAEANLATVGF